MGWGRGSVCRGGMAERLRTEPGKESVLTHDELRMPETSSCRSPRSFEIPIQLSSLFAPLGETKAQHILVNFCLRRAGSPEPEDPAQLLLT